MVMPQDINGTMAEIRRCRKDYGFIAIFVRPNPVRERNWHDPAYDPLWALCEREGVVVGFPGGVSSTLPQAIGERFDATCDDSWLTK